MKVEYESGDVVEYDHPELTYIVYPSAELDGVWIGHCLETDVVSQGEGAEQALLMVMEAAGITVALDRREGRDPFDRCAPPEEWPPEKLAEWKEKRRQMRKLRVIKA